MSGSPQPSPPLRQAVVDRLRRLITGTALNRALLGVLIVALVVGVGFGTGYTTSKAAFSDGSAILPKGPGLAQINASSNQVDAQTAVELATRDQTLEVVQVRPDSVWVVNNDTKVATRLPTDTLKPDKTVPKGAATGKLKLMAGDGQTYLLDQGSGKLDKLDGSRGKAGTVQVPPVADAVADSRGTVWAYTAPTGELLEIVDGALKARQAVSEPGTTITLTTVSDLPVVYRSDTGQAVMYDADGPRRQLELGAGQGTVSQPGTTSSLIAVVVRATGTLVIGDFQTQRVRSVKLSGREGNQFDRPLVHKGRVYVPDFTKLHVLIVEVATERVRSERVPSPSGQFQLTARDDRVWVNDQKSRFTLSFDANGKRTQIDSGDTEGAEDKPLPTPSPTPTPTPPVTKVSNRPQTPQSKIVTPTAAPKPRSTTVPDLVGKDRAAACAELRPELRCVEVAREDSTAQDATGTVLETKPQAGARAPRGSAVTVYYRGPLAVPNVTDVSADKACEALDEAGLKCAKQPSGKAATVAKVGVVQAQSPAAGSPAATGTTVTITFPDQIEVGTYTNQPIADACAVISQAGLVCKQQETGQGAPAGVVQSQDPAPGTGLAPGATVTINFLGNPVVPAVTEMAPEAACAAIAQAKLKCAPKATAATLDVNKVLHQSPAAGSRHPADTAVTIVYQAISPVALNRFKAPGAKRGGYLSAGGGGPTGWSSQGTIGRVYPLEAVGKVDGLSVIYRQRCEAKCGEVGGYYFTGNQATQPNWVADGQAFACFAQPVPGTVPLRALFNKEAAAWAWAPFPSGVHDAFTQGGFGSEYDFTVCHVWPHP
ncbi:PASTA domain-containing protein [Nonomuraea turkmeniaca]|uniref:PASTA domain-containing protein n=1 Tax=Nonomuraea turkmeniaca TaxID=103838 RepID=A0A5S4FL40_9ACTN|nr:PASTA domain-containing protein [Nonomuraea turkmeniaca]TMR20941.1 PASTA domain-containing protein [Nonomuraea turkmeniaca]